MQDKNLIRLIDNFLKELNKYLPNVKYYIDYWPNLNGCYIQIDPSDNFPYASFCIDRRNNILKYSIASIWHGPGNGGSRFGDPKEYESLDELFIRVEDMKKQYNEAKSQINAR